jgi:hypothetical protein
MSRLFLSRNAEDGNGRAGDGEITAQELAAARARAEGARARQREAAAKDNERTWGDSGADATRMKQTWMFGGKVVDADGDGEITKAEWCGTVAAPPPPVLSLTPASAFGAFGWKVLYASPSLLCNGDCTSLGSQPGGG